jgi:hypothetical protein
VKTSGFSKKTALRDITGVLRSREPALGRKTQSVLREGGSDEPVAGRQRLPQLGFSDRHRRPNLSPNSSGVNTLGE